MQAHSHCHNLHTHTCTNSHTHTHTQNSPVVSTDVTSSSSNGGGNGLGGGVQSMAPLKVMAAEVVAAANSHGVATSSTAGALGFPHIDSKQPETVDQTLRRKQAIYDSLLGEGWGRWTS